MVDVKDLLDELEKVNIEPLFVPTLTLIDTVMGGLPKGSVQALLSEKSGTQDSMVKLVEEMSPQFPMLIRFLGTIAESAVTTFFYKIFITLCRPVLKVVTPVFAGLMLRMVGPVVNIIRKIKPALPPVVKTFDFLWKIEVLFEKGVRRLLPA